MNYRVEGKSGDRYTSAKRHLDILVVDIDREFNGNTKSTYRLYASGEDFYVDVVPTKPLEYEHLYIPFIAKVFDVANDMIIPQQGDEPNKDDDSMKQMMMAVIQQTFNGKGAPASSNALLAQLRKAQQMQAQSEYKVKRLIIEDGEGSFFEALKSSKEEELRLTQEPPAKFDWKTAYIRIPKE